MQWYVGLHTFPLISLACISWFNASAHHALSCLCLKGNKLFQVKGQYNIEHEPRILRRQLVLVFLNVLGFTRFSFTLTDQGLNLIQALNYLEHSKTSDVLQLNATIDFSWEEAFSSVQLQNNSFITRFPTTPKTRELPLYRSIQTTAESCLRHLLPLLWVRIQGSAALLQDQLLMQGSAIAFPSAADGRAEVWIIVPTKPSWDRAGNRLQRQLCLASQAERTFRSYLAEQEYQATADVYDPADLSQLPHAEMPTFTVQVDAGALHYQFHRRSCQRWASLLEPV
jgi:hypothetical protein